MGGGDKALVAGQLKNYFFCGFPLLQPVYSHHKRIEDSVGRRHTLMAGSKIMDAAELPEQIVGSCFKVFRDNSFSSSSVTLFYLYWHELGVLEKQGYSPEIELCINWYMKYFYLL